MLFALHRPPQLHDGQPGLDVALDAFLAWSGLPDIDQHGRGVTLPKRKKNAAAEGATRPSPVVP